MFKLFLNSMIYVSNTGLSISKCHSTTCPMSGSHRTKHVLVAIEERSFLYTNPDSFKFQHKFFYSRTSLKNLFNSSILEQTI